MGNQAYSMVQTLILTGGDFQQCISAFNKITPDANLVVQEATHDKSKLVILNIPNGIPTKEFLVNKTQVEEANSDQQTLSSLLTTVLDHLYYDGK